MKLMRGSHHHQLGPLGIVPATTVLQPAVVDWISGNYNYKMGVARIKKLGESRYKKEFRSMSFAPRNIV